MRTGHVVVIGASIGGLRTVEGLRQVGFEGKITLVGDEVHAPYSRPPLSKQVLAGTWEPERTALRTAEKLADLDAELRLGVRAERLDPAAHQVTLSDGPLDYDALVVATGAAPRRLPGDDRPGVHVLRRLDDAVALREDLVPGAKVVVVGAGFIGSEVAATVRERGLDVTVVEPLAAPMVRGLGPELGEIAAQMHREHGVDLRCGVGLDGFVGDDRVTGVALTDGTEVPADVVVVGVGVIPNVGWLEGAGMDLSDGVLCDATLAVEGVDDVWAVGDVARWRHPHFDQPVRFEHWTVASDHGRAVAENIVAGPGQGTPHAPVPYVWTDQFGTKIQILGRPGPDDDVEVVAGSVDDRKFVAVVSRDGALTGAVAFAMPRPLMMLFGRLGGERLTPAEAREVVEAAVPAPTPPAG